MTDWFVILSQPITQLGGIIGFLMLLQKAGFDIKALVRSSIGIDTGVNDVNSDMRTALQPLLTQMETLSQYANHDTTRMHEKTQEKLDELTEHTKDVGAAIRELKEYGIKCRKE